MVDCWLMIADLWPVWNDLLLTSLCQALEKRTSELKRSRESQHKNDKDEKVEKDEDRKEVKEDRERDREDGKSEDEDRNKLPQVVGDENQKAILVDPRGWARERLATALREKGKDLEQKDRSQDKPKAFDAPSLVGQAFRSRICVICNYANVNLFEDDAKWLTPKLDELNIRK